MADSRGTVVCDRGSTLVPILNFPGPGQPNSSLNYYDAGLGMIRLAQATNLQTYIDEAQGWCDLWWQYGLDHGYNIVTPRNAGWHTLMACASMFGYNWWGSPVTNAPGSGIGYNLGYWGGAINPEGPTNSEGTDIRETAYLARALALFTHAYPLHGGSASTYCGYSTNMVNNTWLNPWNPPTTRGLYTLINSGQDAYWQDS